MIGSVYAIQCGSSAVKIGWAGDPYRRVRGLSTASPEPLVLIGTLPGSPDDERRVHERLAAHRLRNEWFDLRAPAVQDFVATMDKPSRKEPKIVSDRRSASGALTVADIIARFGTPDDFGRALKLKMETHGALMRRRGSIPAVYWPEIIRISREHGFPVTLDDLRKANPGAVELVPVSTLIAPTERAA